MKCAEISIIYGIVYFKKDSYIKALTLGRNPDTRTKVFSLYVVLLDSESKKESAATSGVCTE